MKFKKIGILFFFMFGLSLLEQNLCAIHCVRNPDTSLATLYLNSINRAQADAEDWFPTEKTDQKSICNEVATSIFGNDYDGVRYTNITFRNSKIDDGSDIPRRNLQCVHSGNEIRIFPVPKNSTVFVSRVNGIRTLEYCLQLKPYYWSAPGVLRFTNGIPANYESNRNNFISQDLPNPLDLLAPPERYALCRLIFHSDYFKQNPTDIQIIGDYGTVITEYFGYDVFSGMMGEFLSDNVYFEDPATPGQLPNRGFGPERIIWCNDKLGTTYHIIYAYSSHSVYLLRPSLTPPSPNGDQFTIYGVLTQIAGLASIDRMQGDYVF